MTSAVRFDKGGRVREVFQHIRTYVATNSPEKQIAVLAATSSCRLHQHRGLLNSPASATGPLTTPPIVHMCSDAATYHTAVECFPTQRGMPCRATCTPGGFIQPPGRKSSDQLHQEPVVQGAATETSYFYYLSRLVDLKRPPTLMVISDGAQRWTVRKRLISVSHKCIGRVS